MPVWGGIGLNGARKVCELTEGRWYSSTVQTVLPCCYRKLTVLFLDEAKYPIRCPTCQELYYWQRSPGGQVRWLGDAINKANLLYEQRMKGAKVQYSRGPYSGWLETEW